MARAIHFQRLKQGPSPVILCAAKQRTKIINIYVSFQCFLTEIFVLSLSLSLLVGIFFTLTKNHSLS